MLVLLLSGVELLWSFDFLIYFFSLWFLEILLALFSSHYFDVLKSQTHIYTHIYVYVYGLKIFFLILFLSHTVLFFFLRMYYSVISLRILGFVWEIIFWYFKFISTFLFLYYIYFGLFLSDCCYWNPHDNSVCIVTEEHLFGAVWHHLVLHTQ